MYLLVKNVFVVKSEHIIQYYFSSLFLSPLNAEKHILFFHKISIFYTRKPRSCLRNMFVSPIQRGLLTS